MAHNTETYYDLVKALIADQQRVWGEQAITVADSVPGLVVADADTIWLNGNEKQITAALAETYIDRFGETAASQLRAAAADYESDIDLPSVLRSSATDG